MMNPRNRWVGVDRRARLAPRHMGDSKLPHDDCEQKNESGETMSGKEKFRHACQRMTKSYFKYRWMIKATSPHLPREYLSY